MTIEMRAAGYYWVRSRDYEDAPVVIAQWSPELGENGLWHYMGVSGSDSEEAAKLDVLSPALVCVTSR